MKRAPLLWSAAALFLVACIVKTNAADGDECSKDDNCKSKTCRAGFCAGSSCSNDGSCESGWKCITTHTDLILFSTSSSRCQPTCGHCPGNQHCSPIAADGELCVPGPERSASFEGPASVTPTKPGTYTVRFEDGRELVSYTWYLVPPNTKATAANRSALKVLATSTTASAVVDPWNNGLPIAATTDMQVLVEATSKYDATSPFPQEYAHAMTTIRAECPGTECAR